MQSSYEVAFQKKWTKISEAAISSLQHIYLVKETSDATSFFKKIQQKKILIQEYACYSYKRFGSRQGQTRLMIAMLIFFQRVDIKDVGKRSIYNDHFT